jgi:drug/metabolite transporter (DMT)-like permease
VAPLYTALVGAVVLPDAPLTGRLIAGIVLAIGGLALAFTESVRLGGSSLAFAGAGAVAVAPVGIAIGSVSVERRMDTVEAFALNGWAMLIGGVSLLAVSATHEPWRGLAWTPASVSSIVYLAAVGSAFGFVAMTTLLRRVKALAMSCIQLIVPFGALGLGALFYGEPIGARAVAGAALVSVGFVVVQVRRRHPVKQ